MSGVREGGGIGRRGEAKGYVYKLEGKGGMESILCTFNTGSMHLERLGFYNCSKGTRQWITTLVEYNTHEICTRTALAELISDLNA